MTPLVSVLLYTSQTRWTGKYQFPLLTQGWRFDGFENAPEVDAGICRRDLSCDERVAHYGVRQINKSHPSPICYYRDSYATGASPQSSSSLFFLRWFRWWKELKNRLKSEESAGMKKYSHLCSLCCLFEKHKIVHSVMLSKKVLLTRRWRFLPFKPC